jgi:hypothetical protein
VKKILSICVLGASIILLPISAPAKIPYAKRSLTSCSGFISNDEIGKLFAAYEAQLPELARAFSIGTSVDGREIWALVLSANPAEESAEPEIRIVGGIHGNECMSVELVVELAEHVIGSYGDDSFFSEIVDRTQITFVPVVNPDGYSTDTASRENANGIDLNRNFGFAWIGHGPSPFSEPEVKALRDLSLDMSFVLGISYHTVADYVNSPWNYTPHHPPDEELFSEMGNAYAGDSGYQVVFGWDWYGIFGDLNDWSYGIGGTFDWTIEMRSDLDMEWSIHQAGIVRFLSFALRGVSGMVTDLETGEPIYSRIDVEPEGAPVFTDPDVGDYHRILLPETYSLTATAPGYESKTVQAVDVPNDDLIVVDFALEPKPTKSNDYAFQVAEMTLPREIDIEFESVEYLNDTLVWDALGPPDRWVYSLSPGGSITLDMGADSWIGDVDGPDLVVVSGTLSDDPVRVLVAQNLDGPFRLAASGSGDVEVDIGLTEFQTIRYVRVVDDGNGPFNDELAGYDLDAVVNITRAPYVPLPPINEVEYTPGGCQCRTGVQAGGISFIDLAATLITF